MQSDRCIRRHGMLSADAKDTSENLYVLVSSASFFSLRATTGPDPNIFGVIECSSQIGS